MDQTTITIAGQTLPAFLCERCGARMFPRAIYDRHVARHVALGSGISSLCVECGNAIFMLDGRRERCQRCKLKQEARQRRAARGRGVGRRKRGAVERTESIRLVK